MGHIEDLSLFLRIVDQGSITKAAEAMNIAKSAVSRRLALLEDRYDAKLINRVPGVWELTNTGKELYPRAKILVDEMDDIVTDFVEKVADPAGPLKVSVPREFGINYLAPALLAFTVKYPEIQLTVDFDNRIVDLSQESYDFAIRITKSLENRSHATQIGSVQHGLFASLRYIEALTKPSCLEDLHNHQLLYYGSARRTAWSFISKSGKITTLEFRPYLNSNSGTFLLNATIDGLGICRLPDFMVSNALKNGDLLQILPSLAMPEMGIYITHAEDRRLNRRMKLFAEEMQNMCSKSATKMVLSG